MGQRRPKRLRDYARAWILRAASPLRDTTGTWAKEWVDSGNRPAARRTATNCKPRGPGTPQSDIDFGAARGTAGDRYRDGCNDLATSPQIRTAEGTGICHGCAVGRSYLRVGMPSARWLSPRCRARDLRTAAAQPPAALRHRDA